MLRLNTELNEARKVLKFLIEQSYVFSSEDLRLIQDAWGWPTKMKPKIEEYRQRDSNSHAPDPARQAEQLRR